VDQSESDQFSSSQRRGRIYLLEFGRSGDGSPTGDLAVIQTLETAAVLDLKWALATHPAEEHGDVPLLAAADARDRFHETPFRPKFFRTNFHLGLTDEMSGENCR
jgi:hypothetical protein